MKKSLQEQVLFLLVRKLVGELFQFYSNKVTTGEGQRVSDSLKLVLD